MRDATRYLALRIYGESRRRARLSLIEGDDAGSNSAGTPTSLQINGELLCTLCLSGKLTPTGMAYLKILKANFFVKALDNHRP